MYCGTDIIEVDRIKNAILTNYKFLLKVFSKKEIEEIDKIKTDVKYERYAGRFAAKEAIYKGISKILCENKLEINFNEIEIINNISLNRRPEVNILNKNINELLREYYIDISISHIKDSAIAVCTVQDKK